MNPFLFLAFYFGHNPIDENFILMIHSDSQQQQIFLIYNIYFRRGFFG